MLIVCQLATVVVAPSVRDGRRRPGASHQEAVQSLRRHGTFCPVLIALDSKNRVRCRGALRLLDPMLLMIFEILYLNAIT